PGAAGVNDIARAYSGPRRARIGSGAWLCRRPAPPRPRLSRAHPPASARRSRGPSPGAATASRWWRGGRTGCGRSPTSWRAPTACGPRWWPPTWRRRATGTGWPRPSPPASSSSRYVPAMVERGRGAVINLTSTAGFQALPGSIDYSAAKAFVLVHTEGLHEELRGTGVTATAVAPGPVRTDFHATSETLFAQRLPKLVWVEADRVAED